MSAIVLLATAALAGAFAYECVGLTAALERLADATRQANAVAYHADPTPRAAKAAPPLPPLDAPPPPPRAAPVWPAILRESDTEYVLDRRLIDFVLEQQASLMRSVRVVPASVDGKTYPRLYGVRPDSLLGTLGFENGDCLESINGFDLSTPDRALEAYARLRTADYLEAKVRRRGEIVTLRYRVW